MKVVYLAHPYGGDERNVEDAKRLVKGLLTQYPPAVFLSPLQVIGFCYNDVAYLDGMDYCLELLRRCDELWLCNSWAGKSWQESRGCCMEYAAAKAWDKPIYAVNSEWHTMPLFMPHEHERWEKAMSRERSA